MIGKRRHPSAGRYRQRARLALPLLLLLPLLVDAHEFWLDPQGEQWRSGDTLRIDIRNGEHLRGLAYPFDARLMARAGVVSPTERRALSGRLGDFPAIAIPLTEPGLHLVLLDTHARDLTYVDRDAFSRFLDYHALEEIDQQHQERALPDTRIREQYYRFAKALVFVDPGNEPSPARPTAPLANPALAPQGQRLELIAETNPIGASEVRFTLLTDGRPLANRQVELFYRAPGDAVDRRVRQTDADGRVNFDVSAAGDYLINSVQLRHPADDSNHWISWWASLFFQQPGN